MKKMFNLMDYSKLNYLDQFHDKSSFLLSARLRLLAKLFVFRRWTCSKPLPLLMRLGQLHLVVGNLKKLLFCLQNC